MRGRQRPAAGSQQGGGSLPAAKKATPAWATPREKRDAQACLLGGAAARRETTKVGEKFRPAFRSEI